MGKGIDGTDDSNEGGPYQDFIQQAMTQGVTQGGGFGLAKIIESTLTQRDHAKPAHIDLNSTTLPIMSTTPNKITSPVLREFDSLLEEMIGLQKKEQALILAPQDRRPRRHHPIDRVDGHSDAEHGSWMSAANCRTPAMREEYPQNRMQEKLSQIKRLAQQNHTLLEHSLFFLQQLFQKVLEKRHAPASLQPQRPRLPKRPRRRSSGDTHLAPNRRS